VLLEPVDCNTSFGTLLNKLAVCYSPIRSKCLRVSFGGLFLILGLENNDRIYVREASNFWSVKGRFNHAVNIRDTVDWQVRDGVKMLALLAASLDSRV
jgi:hypothetical protein